MQVCYFHANFKTNWSPKIISNIVLAVYIEPNEKKVWTNMELLIPRVSPTLNDHIIEIKYKLLFSFKTSSLSFAKEVVIPIVIGTIPFGDSNSSTELNPPSYNQIFKNQKY